jgi:hypothetical protein
MGIKRRKKLIIARSNNALDDHDNNNHSKSRAIGDNRHINTIVSEKMTIIVNVSTKPIGAFNSK